MNSTSPPDVAGARRAVLRWHLLSGLALAPLLLILTISGALYLFDRELDRWWLGPDYRVTPDATAPASLVQQEAWLRQRYVQAEPRRVTLPFYADDAFVWQLAEGEGPPRLVYLDPYRLTIKGELHANQLPTTWIRRAHGELLAGEAGSWVVEWVACWTLVMLITGIYLWWPRHWRLGGVVVPRWHGSRVGRWRDWHAVPALWISGMVLFLVLSGLPWSAFWGNQFARLGALVPWVAPSPNFSATPSLAEAAGGAAPNGPLPWAISHHHHGLPPQPGAGATIAVVEPHLTLLPRQQFGPGVRIFYPDAGEPFVVSYVPDKAQGQMTLYVAPDSGQLLDAIDWSRYSATAKVVEWGVMTHLGRQFGGINQAVNLLACVVLCLSLLAGVGRWWLRRGRGEAAAARHWWPAAQAGERLPGPVLGGLMLVAVLFPLVALTLALRWLWLRLVRA